MDASPTADQRRFDAVMAAELAVLLLALAWLQPAWRPWAALAALAGAGLLWRFRGGPAAAWGLTGLLAAACIALALALGERPFALLAMPLLVMQLGLYRNWPLVVACGLFFTAVPLLLPLATAWPDRLALAAFVAVQSAFVAWRARTNAYTNQVLFDVEFLVRAMGRTGRIRLDLDVLRAETATGQRLKDVQDRVAQTLLKVRQSAQAATGAATTLQASGQTLTERTQGADRELSDAAMTLEQIAVIVKDSADAAMTARQTAQAATELAREVGTTVTQMVQQMQAIDAGAQRITDIIGVIDGIAFQTNLLALNAAVEAARAGVHGRGFAVVATEVRTLAKRVTQSAAEIKGLIDESVQASARGNTLARSAGSTMGKLIEAVMRVDTTFHSLSADTNEHAAGLVTMRDTMFQLREAARQNLALAEQSQQIAGSLAGRAFELDDALSAFRLSGDGAVAAVAAGVPAADVQRPKSAAPVATATAPLPAPVSTPAAAADTVEFF